MAGLTCLRRADASAADGFIQLTARKAPYRLYGPDGAESQFGSMTVSNGIAGRSDAPLFRAKRGDSVILESWNDDAFAHVIHLHGHHFRIVERNGQPLEYRDWRDGFLAEPDEKTNIAFVADNPGNWLIHCHMLEHAASGMTSHFEVV